MPDDPEVAAGKQHNGPDPPIRGQAPDYKRDQADVFISRGIQDRGEVRGQVGPGRKQRSASFYEGSCAIDLELPIGMCRMSYQPPVT